MKRKLEMKTHQEIMENVIQEEIEFISWVDVETEAVHIVRTDKDGAMYQVGRGIYSKINEAYIRKFVHPQDRDYCAQQLALSNIKERLEKREKFFVEYRLLCGMEYRYKELSIYYHDREKKKIIFVRYDVTECYRERQRQKEKLYGAFVEVRKANRSKGEFLTRMSHEIRIPMNSILGLVYLSRENADNQRQVLENLDQIDKSVHFMLSFVDDILNMSQIELGNIALYQEDVDFRQFLNELSRDIRVRADQKNIQFFVELRGRLEREYHFDQHQLRKVLFNILQNAVKFTQQNGRVDFIAELLHETGEEAVIRFEIRDNGVGMEGEFLPYAFDVFEQESSESVTIHGGTGIGLSIAKNIVDMMGGRIEVYSKKGKGSTFIVTVALKKAADCEERIRKQNKCRNLDYDFSGKRVLLVDDDEINIEITKNILMHKNFEVEVALNGEEGLTCFLEHETGYYDVILMDIRMPVMDGLTATRRIRAASYGESRVIPIIAMTANAFEEDVRKSFEAGMNAHLSKPVDIRQMYAVLDEIISK